MTVAQLYSHTVIVATALAGATFLWLQLAAWRRHRHSSFFVLFLSTVFGCFYFAFAYIGGRLLPIEADPPLWVYLTSAVLILGQLALGVWGTVLLYRSYARLADAASDSHTGDNGDDA